MPYADKEKERLWYKRKYQRRKGSPQLRARDIICHAVYDGRIIRPNTCSSCNSPKGRIEAHHKDHNKPFEVTWLCQKCHIELHKLKG